MSSLFFKNQNAKAGSTKVAKVFPSTDQEFVERRKFPRPMPVPEVIEGNGGPTDWAMFEEAVQEQNKHRGPRDRDACRD